MLGWVRTDIVAPIGIVIAIAVTLHVLLRKRDIGASIGWIGLAWLAPVLGCDALFHVRHQPRQRAAPAAARRAALAPHGGAPPPQIERDDHLAPLDAAARRITAAPGRGRQPH